jgi:hypothetical protein
MLNRESPLDRNVVRVYAEWLRRVAPGSYDNALEGDLYKLSERVHSDDNYGVATYLLDCNDGGGPAEVFVIYDDSSGRVTSLFQHFEGPRVCYEIQGRKEIYHNA